MHSPRRYLYLLSYFIHPRAPKSVFSNQDFGLSFPDFAFEMKYSLTSQWHKLISFKRLHSYWLSCCLLQHYCELLDQTNLASIWMVQVIKCKQPLNSSSREEKAFSYWKGTPSISIMMKWKKKIAWRWAPGISRETTGFNLIWEVVWGITFIWLGNHQGPGCLLS